MKDANYVITLFKIVFRLSHMMVREFGTLTLILQLFGFIIINIIGNNVIRNIC